MPPHDALPPELPESTLHEIMQGCHDPGTFRVLAGEILRLRKRVAELEYENHLREQPHD